MGPDAGRGDLKGIWAISAIYVGDGPNAGGDLGNPHRFTLPAVKDGHRDGDQRRGDHRRSRQKLRSAGQPGRRHQDASRVSGEPSLFGRTVGSGLNPNGPRRALGRLELAAKRVEAPPRYLTRGPWRQVPAAPSAKNLRHLFTKIRIDGIPIPNDRIQSARERRSETVGERHAFDAYLAERERRKEFFHFFRPQPFEKAKFQKVNESKRKGMKALSVSFAFVLFSRPMQKTQCMRPSARRGRGHQPIAAATSSRRPSAVWV